jgi:hypothetical protein
MVGINPNNIGKNRSMGRNWEILKINIIRKGKNVNRNGCNVNDFAICTLKYILLIIKILFNIKVNIH